MRRDFKIAIFKNFSSLIVAQAIYKVATFITLIIVARFLGVEGFGKLSFGMSFVWFFLFLSDFGFSDLFVRDVAHNSNLYQKYVNNIITLKIIVGSINIIFIILIALYYFFGTEKFWIVSLLGASIVLDSFMYFFRCIFRVKETMEYEGALMVLEALLKLGIILLIIRSWSGLTPVLLISFSFFIVSIANFIVNLIVFRLSYRGFHFDFDKKLCQYLLKTAFPFAFVYIFSLLSFKTDVVLLSFFKGDYYAGLFNAALKMMEQFILIPITLAAVYFPLFSRIRGEGRDFHKILLRSIFVLLTLSACIIIFCYYFGINLIMSIYGNKFIDVSQYIFYFSLILLPFLIKPIIEKALYALGIQVLVGKIYFFSVTLNILLCLIAIPVLGINGAIFATLLSESLAVVVCSVVYFKRFKNPELKYQKIDIMNIDIE